MRELEQEDSCSLFPSFFLYSGSTQATTSLCYTIREWQNQTRVVIGALMTVEVCCFSILPSVSFDDWLTLKPKEDQGG